DPRCNGPITALLVKDGIVYACGNYTQIGNEAMRNAAALDATVVAGTPIPGWSPVPGGTVNVTLDTGSSILMAGGFNPIHNQPQAYLALIGDAVTGVPSAPVVSHGVQLAPGRPNPAAGATPIGLTARVAGHVTPHMRH